jgi:hypothetical protein
MAKVLPTPGAVPRYVRSDPPPATPGILPPNQVISSVNSEPGLLDARESPPASEDGIIVLITCAQAKVL